MDVRISFERHRQRRASSGRREHYPTALRARALAYLRERRAHGATVAEVARELGISRGTLGAWESAPEPATRMPTLRPVEVMAGLKTASPIVVRGARGIVIEGLDLDGIAALLAKVSA
jgi:hypothetical protein